MHTKLLDQAALVHLEDLQAPGEPDIVHRAVKLFLDGTPELVATIHLGLRCHDLGAVYRATETLTAAAADVGATRLHEASLRLQARCRIHNATFDDLLEEFERAYAATIDALSKESAS